MHFGRKENRDQPRQGDLHFGLSLWNIFALRFNALANITTHIVDLDF